MSYGFVYILGNPAFPGIYKIGMTERSPSLRCKELSGSTSVPSPFVLIAYYEFEDARLVEQETHRHLAEYRVNDGREFFDVNLFSIVETIRGGFCPISEYESYMVEMSGKGMDPFKPSKREPALALRD